MTTQRVWIDTKAEAQFWNLMREYEAVVARARPGRFALLTLGALRGKLALRRSHRIEAEAKALVDRFTRAANEIELVTEPSTIRNHPALLIAATLANDTGARRTTERAVTGTKS
ncbi:hypothetical protein [Aureimonas sp. AU12]|uniref:hypothetical protein n=1 Tax=Aureimonas sp. AU12 TaxID=1638161 RepID=UPI0007061C20|nr:hypothetical protein [Aureimonas sp. AU12]BAT29711.1 hypothetical protein [Aureimonas sp. AU12]